MTHPLRVHDDGRDKVEEDVIAISFLNIFQFGSGHFQLVQTLEEHSLSFLLHVVIGGFLGVGGGGGVGRRGSGEEGGWVGGGVGRREGGGREGDTRS